MSVPGNQNAAKPKIWGEAIRRAIARRQEGDLSKGLDVLADKLVDAAAAGEVWALTEVGNRLDGKPPQAIIGGDEDDPAIKIQEVKRVIVRAKPESSNG